jgi:dTMP kinase
MIFALEGMDASGKATQSRLLKDYCESKVFQNRIGGGAFNRVDVFDFPHYTSPVGMLIKGVLTGELDTASWNKADKALMLQSLFLSNRFEHYVRLMQYVGSLDLLILDRYVVSGLVYGSADGLDLEYLTQIHKALPVPDLYIYIDIPQEESVKRRPERRDEYEKREGFMAKVRSRYLELFRSYASDPAPKESRRWQVVDGMGSVDEVHNRIVEAVHKLFEVEP